MKLVDQLTSLYTPKALERAQLAKQLNEEEISKVTERLKVLAKTGIAFTIMSLRPTTIEYLKSQGLTVQRNVKHYKVSGWALEQGL